MRQKVEEKHGRRNCREAGASQCKNQEPVMYSATVQTPPAETIEDHYRRNLTIPLVDHLINELENGFGSGDQETAVQCLFAVPSMLVASKETWMISFGQFSTFHKDSLPPFGP